MNNKKVAVLCAATDTAYKSIPECDVFDKSRDARSFTGGMPVIAHPPCRSWSAFLRHQSKPEAGERELAFWCIEQVKLNSGVLEQPAHSHLFAAAGLPLPGDRAGPGVTICIDQNWFGYVQRKRTWLWFSGVRPPPLPRSAMWAYWSPPPKHGRSWAASLSGRKRSETPPALARWLVDAVICGAACGAAAGASRRRKS